MKEGVTTTIKRRKGEGLAAPLMGGYPLSPIYMLDILLVEYIIWLQNIYRPNICKCLWLDF
jgi:hypothetical protein